MKVRRAVERMSLNYDCDEFQCQVQRAVFKSLDSESEQSLSGPP